MAYPGSLDLEAANDALARIAERPISSFDEGTTAGRAIKRLYPRVRALMFAAADWPFATCKVDLGTPSTAAAPMPWLYQYALPSNVASPRFVQTPNGDVIRGPRHFEIGVATDESSRLIWCDLKPAVLVFTREIEDPALWDAGFYAAFTLQLAAEIALPVTGKGQLAREMADAAQRAIQTQLMGTNQVSSVTTARGPSTTELARAELARCWY